MSRVCPFSPALGGIMRSTAVAAVLLAACLPLTACGGSKPSAGPTVSASAPSTGGPTPSSAPSSSPTSTAGQGLQLGQPARTDGATHPAVGTGGGVLELTPTSVVYAKSATGATPKGGLFAVVAIKARSMTAVAAAETAPITGGGWQWIAPDGQAISTMAGSANNVTPDGFMASGPVQPGTYVLTSAAFDISAAQKGGTLMYTDGSGNVFRWRIPAADSGPQAGQLKSALAG